MLPGLEKTLDDADIVEELLIAFSLVKSQREPIQVGLRLIFAFRDEGILSLDQLSRKVTHACQYLLKVRRERLEQLRTVLFNVLKRLVVEGSDAEEDALVFHELNGQLLALQVDRLQSGLAVLHHVTLSVLLYAD